MREFDVVVIGAGAAGEVKSPVRPSQRWAWLRATAGHPTLWGSAVTYVVLTAIAGRGTRRRGNGADAWGHDMSTRGRADPSPEGTAP